MKNNNVRAIVLAAGRSSRFRTDKSKLLYSVCGQAMILYPIKLLKKMDIPITVVVGYQADEVKKIINDAGIKVDYVLQKKQLGTGNAISLTKKSWDKDNILIMNGDGPLLTEDVLQDLISNFTATKSVFSFLSAHALNPRGYGRVIRDGKSVSIIEEKNLTEDQKFITLVNAGIYLASKSFLNQNMDKIQIDAKKGEYYFTDLAEIASKQNKKVTTIPVAYDDIRGINTMEELWAVEQIKRSQIIKYWMNNGVRFQLAQNIHLDWNVKIGAGSFIGTGVHLIGDTVIGKNSNINAFSIVESSEVGNNSSIHSHTVVQNSKIGDNSHVGPFARLRNNVLLGNNVNIGNFVELKNSTIGDNTSAKHLTYLGDSIIGQNVNIGAGTITCNYDGMKKHTTTIKDNVFIGSNNTLVAPVKIEKNAYTAAGSTITKDLPENSLGIARTRQENKINYAKKLRSPKKKSNTSSDKSKLNFVGAVKIENIKNL